VGIALELRETGEPSKARDCESYASDLGQVASELAFLCEARKDDWVYWLEEPWNPHSLRMCGSPLAPGAQWAENFFSWIGSALFTSATLATQGNFEYFERRMGLDHARRKVQTKIFESPWNTDDLRKVVIADFLPKPSDPKYQEALDTCLAAILPERGENTMLLYTSVASLKKSHGVLSPLFAQKHKLLLSQPHDGNLDGLLAMFRKEQGACLMGTQMCWEGIDLPGKELELLVIPKLPFPTPGDPLVAARQEAVQARRGNAFKEIFVPEALLDLRQGMGRLIRSETDKGTVVFFDSRILHEGYGRNFRKLWNEKHLVAHNLEELKALL
jgi:DNA polymerase-3 subunit epsilon/ATP-dependent DNA helicase DinG